MRLLVLVSHALSHQEGSHVNQYQALNNALFAGTLIALVAGLARDQTPWTQRPLALWFFITFYFLLRLKIFWDDQQYFGRTATKNVFFKLGVVVGIVSWVFWVAAAWTTSTLRDAYFLCGVAICISTIWIVIDTLKGAYSPQYFWIISNALFVIFLWWASRRSHLPTDLLTLIILGLAVGIVVVDFFVSKSVPELEN